MGKLVLWILDFVARIRLVKRPNIEIASSAKIKYRRIVLKKANYLTVGGGSIVEGTIFFDRDTAGILIGDNTYIGASALISAEKIEIGNDVLIAWGCTIVDHNSHSVVWSERRDDVRNWYRGVKDWKGIKRAPVMIGDKAWIGFNAIILPGVTVGEGAVVGAGSVVTKDVPPYTIVAGNPARIIREIPIEER
jgi:acetyltransferase-like isoleucine patch superfamily enzyme